LDVVEAKQASRGTAARSNREAEVCVVCSKLGVATLFIDEEAAEQFPTLVLQSPV
jgi:hypothetical protein